MTATPKPPIQPRANYCPNGKNHTSPANFAANFKAARSQITLLKPRTRVRTGGTIRKAAARQGRHWHPKSLMPPLPSLRCENPCWRIFQNPPELVLWYMMLDYGHICRRSVNHDVRQECFSIFTASGRSYHTTFFRHFQQLFRVGRCQGHRSQPSRAQTPFTAQDRQFLNIDRLCPARQIPLHLGGNPVQRPVPIKLQRSNADSRIKIPVDHSGHRPSPLLHKPRWQPACGDQRSPSNCPGPE